MRAKWHTKAAVQSYFALTITSLTIINVRYRVLQLSFRVHNCLHLVLGDLNCPNVCCLVNDPPSTIGLVRARAGSALAASTVCNEYARTNHCLVTQTTITCYKSCRVLICVQTGDLTAVIYCDSYYASSYGGSSLVMPVTGATPDGALLYTRLSITTIPPGVRIWCQHRDSNQGHLQATITGRQTAALRLANH